MYMYTTTHHSQPYPHTRLSHPAPYITSTYTPPQHCRHHSHPHPCHPHPIYTTPTHTQQSTLQHAHPIHPTTTYPLQRIAVRCHPSHQQAAPCNNKTPLVSKPLYPPLIQQQHPSTTRHQHIRKYTHRRMLIAICTPLHTPPSHDATF